MQHLGNGQHRWAATVTAGPADAAPAASEGATAAASAALLVLYARIPVDSVKIDGDRRHFDLLLEWDPDE
ncbi:hypothetical protein AB0K00_36810 [Dactylosporangium sp. NPDC049525]|uniref:hypothetical protein n=1 Tax=Dactylosporangium sp. NPDC049525 TaxID=3154730 RepID=UPI00342C2B3E